MSEEPDRKPLGIGRGVLPFEDFCRSTGLDDLTVERLMRTQLADISLWKEEGFESPYGLFDDALPSRRDLAAMGLPVRADYDPETLRSHDGTADMDDDFDEGTDEDAGPTWTLTW